MPVYPKLEEILIYEGLYFVAEWYYTDAGQLPALEYYSSMRVIDQGRFDDFVEYICNLKRGDRPPQTMYRIEDSENKIYALKPRDERFFNFTTVGAKVIITNAYHKRSQKVDRDELAKAIRFREDYLRRVQGGTYYEK